MAITVDALVKSTSPTFQHTCSGDNSLLIVGVSYVPLNFGGITSITYDGINLTLYPIMVGDNLGLCVGYLINPPVGTHDVMVTAEDFTNMLCESVSFNGVKQDDAVWRIRDGVGIMVTAIPINTFARIDDVTLGIGAVNDIESGNDGLYGNQVLVWDNSGTGLRMDGISAVGTSNYDVYPLPNKLTKPSYWALILLGIHHA